MLAENQTKNIWYHRVSTRSATGMGAMLSSMSTVNETFQEVKHTRTARTRAFLHHSGPRGP